MIDSTTLASEPKVAAASPHSSAASAPTGGTSEPKVEAASPRCVLASCVDSPTIPSQTPAQAPQADNVRKCPVLSGPTDPDEQTDLSPDTHTTCDPNPSCAHQTSAAPEPPAVPQQDQMPQRDIHPLAPRQNQPIDPLNDDSIPLTSVLRKTIVSELTQHLGNEEQRDLHEQAAHASPQATTP